MLGKRKKDKEDAYVKYLRTNTTNVVDGLRKQQQNINEPNRTQYAPEVHKPSLPKQSVTHYQEHRGGVNNFDALDLQVQVRVYNVYIND